MLIPSKTQTEQHAFVANASDAGMRLDVFLAARLQKYSRTLLAEMIRDGQSTIAGIPTPKVKPSLRIELGMTISVTLPVLEEARLAPAHGVELPVLYDDKDIVAFDKPAGLPTHAQRPDDINSVASVMAARYGSDLPHSPGGDLRPGIVHRLDADTTGVIVCAKTQVAFDGLKRLFRERAVQKTYLAIALGIPRMPSFTVDAPLERNPQRPQSVRVNKERGRSAQTEFEVLETFPDAGMSYVRAKPLTGRTHQIRMHLLHAGHPVIGDRLYGARNAPAVKDAQRANNVAVQLNRHALHAHELAFVHPVTGVPMTIKSEVPADMMAALTTLRGG